MNVDIANNIAFASETKLYTVVKYESGTIGGNTVDFSSKVEHCPSRCPILVLNSIILKEVKLALAVLQQMWSTKPHQLKIAHME